MDLSADELKLVDLVAKECHIDAYKKGSHTLDETRVEDATSLTEATSKLSKATQQLTRNG